MEKEIRNMNVKELKARAKERGIKRYYWLRKAQLIESLETETPPTEAPENEIMEAPETEIMEAPENEIMEAPENEIWKHQRIKLWMNLCLKLKTSSLAN